MLPDENKRKDFMRVFLEFDTMKTTVSDLITQYPLTATLLALMLLDVITGLTASFFFRKDISSSASKKGMVGKAMILAVVATGRLMELLMPGYPWSQILAGAFCITEAISILENAADCGIPVPSNFMEAMQKLKAKKAQEGKPRIEIHPPTNTTTDIAYTPKIDKTPSERVTVKIQDSAVMNSDDILKK